MRHKRTQPVLWVKAKEGSHSRVIDENGNVLKGHGLNILVIGKDEQGNVIPEGVKIFYHWHHIKEIKDGALIPMDFETAELAGVQFDPELTK